MKNHQSHLEAELDDSPSQEIAQALQNEKTIAGHGRTQHGLNGKDADLDPCGQIVVESIHISDPVKSATLFLEASLLCYASICEPENESDMDIAQEIVCDATAYEGEWTGSDYWHFRHRETVKVPLSVDEYDAGTAPKNLSKLAHRLATACYKSKGVRAFEKFCRDLNEQLSKIKGTK